jgi:hypothetical protein
MELNAQWAAEMGRAIGGARAMLESGMENLGDDELMMLVGQYTRQIDIEIRQHMTGMRTRANQSRNYNAAIAEMNRQVSNAGNERGNTKLDLEADVKIINERGEEQTVKLGALMNSLGIKLPTNPKLSVETVEAIKTAVNTNVENIRAQNEQGQLELQQIMSRRSQMLQITSNIFASRNETKKSITQNIRG